LAACCFMSGLMCVFHFMFTFPTFWTLSRDAVTFSSIFIWCGFQTGNSVQVRHSIEYMVFYICPFIQ
jgi:hypothetical protein